MKRLEIDTDLGRSLAAGMTPAYVHALLDAFLTGEPLNFGKADVPADVQARLTEALNAGVLRGVPAEAGPYVPDQTEPGPGHLRAAREAGRHLG